MDPDGTVGDAVLVGCDHWNRAYQFPSFGAGLVDPQVQAADHPLITLAEYHHPVKIFPLHHSHSFSPLLTRAEEMCSSATCSASQPAVTERTSEFNFSSPGLNQRGKYGIKRFSCLTAG